MLTSSLYQLQGDGEKEGAGGAQATTRKPLHGPRGAAEEMGMGRRSQTRCVSSWSKGGENTVPPAYDTAILQNCPVELQEITLAAGVSSTCCVMPCLNNLREVDDCVRS